MKALLVFLVSCPFLLQGQHRDSVGVKGSYASYGQPAIEDNSMFVDEAFNQPEKIIQHIATCELAEGQLNFNYTVEAPFKTVKNQLSLSLPWVLSRENAPGNSAKPGDAAMTWRCAVLGKEDPILLVPGISLIVPTGNPRLGSGNGGLGTQLSIAMTKRWHRKLVSHFNLGGTFIRNADFFAAAQDGQSQIKVERHLATWNSGASVIWLAGNRMNVFLEYTNATSKTISKEYTWTGTSTSIINPAFRTLIGHNDLMIVAGMGIPFVFMGNEVSDVNLLFYFSIEPFQAAGY